MQTFQLVVNPRVITCEEVRRKLPRSRLLFYAAGVEFYYLGRVGKDFDKVANVAMNKMIEIGRKAGELKTAK